MKFLVLAHLLNDEEEEFTVSNVNDAFSILSDMIMRHDAAQIYYWQIQPIHEEPTS